MTVLTAAAATAGHLPRRGACAQAGGVLCPQPESIGRSLPLDRRGRLRNGARPGDFLAARRCGARTRAKGCCRQPAMANGRCRFHGGKSTGPRTAEGRRRCREVRLIHGGYAAEIKALRRQASAHVARLRVLTALLRGRATPEQERLFDRMAQEYLAGAGRHAASSATASAARVSAGHGVLCSHQSFPETQAPDQTGSARPCAAGVAVYSPPPPCRPHQGVG